MALLKLALLFLPWYVWQWGHVLLVQPFSLTVSGWDPVFPVESRSSGITVLILGSGWRGEGAQTINGEIPIRATWPVLSLGLIINLDPGVAPGDSGWERCLSESWKRRFLAGIACDSCQETPSQQKNGGKIKKNPKPNKTCWEQELHWESSWSNPYGRFLGERQEWCSVGWFGVSISQKIKN